MEPAQPAPGQPAIASFVIRFVQSSPGAATDAPDETLTLAQATENREPEQPSAFVRGHIRHIQSDQELAFTHWPDAVRFIEQFVDLTPLHE